MPLKHPVSFVAHGSPTLATDEKKGRELRAWAELVPAPSSILVVSAHWEECPLTLSAVDRPETIHDFGGFPKELYELRYAAPGAPELAESVVDLLGSRTVERSDRGLDHGAWVPLLHMFPQRDVPVLQLSMPRDMSPEELYSVGAALSPLRERGVWILGSGNLVHNLRLLDWSDRGPPPSWAVEFDAWVVETLSSGDVDALLAAERSAPAFQLAHPTDEHLRPLYVVAGAGELGDSELLFPVTGFEFGNLSRRCVQFESRSA